MKRGKLFPLILEAFANSVVNCKRRRHGDSLLRERSAIENEGWNLTWFWNEAEPAVLCIPLI